MTETNMRYARHIKRKVRHAERALQRALDIEQRKRERAQRAIQLAHYAQVLVAQRVEALRDARDSLLTLRGVD